MLRLKEIIQNVIHADLHLTFSPLGVGPELPCHIQVKKRNSGSA